MPAARVCRLVSGFGVGFVESVGALPGAATVSDPFCEENTT
jgi:hypothetical protein